MCPRPSGRSARSTKSLPSLRLRRTFTATWWPDTRTAAPPSRRRNGWTRCATDCPSGNGGVAPPLADWLPYNADLRNRTAMEGKFGKIVLVVLGVILMIVFILPAGLQNMAGSDATLGTLAGEKVRRGDIINAD